VYYATNWYQLNLIFKNIIIVLCTLVHLLKLHLLIITCTSDKNQNRFGKNELKNEISIMHKYSMYVGIGGKFTMDKNYLL
jgi:hypothetical protein